MQLAQFWQFQRFLYWQPPLSPASMAEKIQRAWNDCRDFALHWSHIKLYLSYITEHTAEFLTKCNGRLNTTEEGDNAL